MNKLAAAVTLIVLLADTFPSDPVGAQEPRGPSPLGQYYGFQPVEIFKLELRSSNLVARDLDRDGLVDLIVADNSHSRIDYLHQRRLKPAAAPVDDADGEVNQVQNDWRFEHRKIPVDRQVDFVALAREQSLEGQSDRVFVFDYENSGLHSGPPRFARLGIVSTNSVPWPGSDVSSMVPP